MRFIKTTTMAQRKTKADILAEYNALEDPNDEQQLWDLANKYNMTIEQFIDFLFF